MAPLIITEELVKDYGVTRALDSVDISIEEGEWVSVMGRSGSGKSTLLNLIGGLDTPSSGKVFYRDTDLAGLSEKERALYRRETIGFIFQEYYLVSYLNAVENVMMAQYFHSMPDEEEAVEALEKVGLGHRTHHLPSQLSGGEQQRVCIARALINSPAVLLADEPTGNLDRENSDVILELLRKLHEEENFTIVMVTHDPLVSDRGGRRLVLVDGAISGEVDRG